MASLTNFNRKKYSNWFTATELDFPPLNPMNATVFYALWLWHPKKELKRFVTQTAPGAPQGCHLSHYGPLACKIHRHHWQPVRSPDTRKRYVFSVSVWILRFAAIDRWNIMFWLDGIVVWCKMCTFYMWVKCFLLYLTMYESR